VLNAIDNGPEIGDKLTALTRLAVPLCLHTTAIGAEAISPPPRNWVATTAALPVMNPSFGFWEAISLSVYFCHSVVLTRL
jgi:hypothetical protein